MHKLLILDYISCSTKLLGQPTYDFLNNYVFFGVRIAVPIVLIILIMKDIISAVISSDEKQMKTAQTNAIKRIIVGVIIELLPTIINTVMALIGIVSGTC